MSSSGTMGAFSTPLKPGSYTLFVIDMAACQDSLIHERHWMKTHYALIVSKLDNGHGFIQLAITEIFTAYKHILLVKQMYFGAYSPVQEPFVVFHLNERGVFMGVTQNIDKIFHW